jgi:hypothetical protein
MQCTTYWVDFGDGNGRHYGSPNCVVIYDDGGYDGGGGGGDAGDTAKKNYEDFKNKNKGCAELAKTLGLDKLIDKVSHIDAKGDDKLLDKTLKELDFPYFSPDATDYVNEQDLKPTLREIFTPKNGGTTWAMANWKTNTIYYNGTGPSDVASFGFTVFHELLHIAFKGDHGAIAEQLGIYTPRTITDSNGNTMKIYNDGDAKKKLDEFMKADCDKEKVKK